MIPAGLPAQRGRVVEFDDAAGLGVVENAGGERFMFHCVEIADGSREIGVGSEVGFQLLAKFGRWEAANVGP